MPTFRVVSILGCLFTLGACAPKFIASGGAWLTFGALAPVTLSIPWNGETNKISTLYESATRFRGTCVTGATVYVFDATTGLLLKSGSCTAGLYDLTADFSSYAEGSVSVKLTQISAAGVAASSHVSITFTKETTYCKNSSNTGAVPNGAGTVGDPYLICTMDQFRTYFINANASGGFRFRNDLDATGVTDLDARMSGPTFSGTLDGNAFGIYNYTNDVSMISEITGGTIQDLKFRDVNMSLTASSGVVAYGFGFGGGGGTFNGVSVHGVLNSTTETGGLFAYQSSGSSVIANSWVDLTINATGQVGGLFVSGRSYTITDSWTRGSFTAAGGTGGIANGACSGGNTTTMTRVHSSAVISNTSSQTGGLVGHNSGCAPLDIVDSYFDGASISTFNGYVGGLVGWAPGDLTVTNSYAATDILPLPGAVSNGRGGLIGRFDLGNATIDRSFFQGNISAPNGERVGGLVGMGGTTVTITDSYALGSITSVGGLCSGLLGESGAGHTVNTSYAEVAVTCAGTDDAFDREAAGSYVDTYHNTDVEPDTNGSSTSLTSAQFTSAASFSGFTFDATHWVMGSTRPRLYWE